MYTYKQSDGSLSAYYNNGIIRKIYDSIEFPDSWDRLIEYFDEEGNPLFVVANAGNVSGENYSGYIAFDGGTAFPHMEIDKNFNRQIRLYKNTAILHRYISELMKNGKMVQIKMDERRMFSFNNPKKGMITSVLADKVNIRSGDDVMSQVTGVADAGKMCRVLLS